jgi:2-haloacid dehalogenase
MSGSTFGGFQGIVFDAYGTLFDVAGIDRACAAVSDDPAAFTRLWRAKQLEYSVLRTVMDRYVDFGQITSDALDYTATYYGVDLDPMQRGDLMRSWQELPAFPDVPLALDHLHAAGQRLAVLSNGTRQMLDPLLRRGGLRQYLFAVLTSERVQTFKPDVNVYLMVSEHFHARMNEILFVTANGFDVAGAKAAGLSVCRVNRAGLPLDPLGYDPDLTVRDLDGLVTLLFGDLEAARDGGG